MTYDYQPIRKNYLAHITVMWLFVLAGVSFAASAALPPHPALWQSVGLILLLPAIQLIARYLATRHLYRIRACEDGSTDLEVYLYRGGDKMQLVCRVGLTEITAVTPLGAQNKRPPKGIKRYNYAPDLRPAEALVLSVSNADGECEVLLCPDARMAALLEKSKEAHDVPLQKDQTGV